MQPGQNTSGAGPVALEYLRQLEDGTQPILADYEVRLGNEAERSELRELVGAARWARDRYPAPFRAEVVVDGRYRLIRQIGAGGYGKVWLAEDIRLSRDVALKIVTAFGDAEAAAKGIRNEVATLGRLSHRGIVRLFDSGTHDGSCYVAMEFVAGKSLADLIDLLPSGPVDAAGIHKALDCPIPSGEIDQVADDWDRFATGVVVELLWALGAAHGSGVIHRDLKPANVMLTGSGRPILLDFGLAGMRDAKSGTITKGLFGTTPYLAPEQLADGRSGKATAIDIYQVGLILYELLTRQRAFTTETHERLVRQVLEGSFPRPRSIRPDLPGPLEDIVLRATARDPARRYASAEGFRTDLERWLEGAQPAASVGGVGMRAVRGVRSMAYQRRRVLALGAALLLGALPVWLLREQPLLLNLKYDAGKVATFELRGKTTVMPLGIWADKDGKVHGYQPAVVVDEQGAQQALVQLEPGSHRLRVAVRDVLPNPPPETHLGIYLVPTENAAEAAAWRKFQPLVADATLRQERPLSEAEMAELQAAATKGGRGDRLPPFALGRIVGDGTSEWFKKR